MDGGNGARSIWVCIAGAGVRSKGGGGGLACLLLWSSLPSGPSITITESPVVTHHCHIYHLSFLPLQLLYSSPPSPFSQSRHFPSNGCWHAFLSQPRLLPSRWHHTALHPARHLPEPVVPAGAHKRNSALGTQHLPVRLPTGPYRVGRRLVVWSGRQGPEWTGEGGWGLLRLCPV